MAQEVIPDFYREPGLQPNRDYVNQSFSEHIDPFSGSLQLHYVDLHLPGNGRFDLKVIRSYNSSSIDPTNPAATDSIAGIGWTIHFGRVMKSRDSLVCSNTVGTSSTDNPVLELPDGSRQLLSFTGGTAPLMLTPQRWRADCLGASNGLLVYAPDGTKYTMAQFVNVGTGVRPIYAWYTTQIVDRNGNSASISYANAASPEISSVSTSDNRSVSFSYAGVGTAQRRITSINGSSRTYSYSYQAVPNFTDKYFLTSVTRPGGTSWNYTYNGDLGASAGSYLVNKMTYPEGSSYSYTYAFVTFDAQGNPLSRSTVVSSKSASSSGSWAFSYSPGGAGTLDTTTVTAPSGTTTYRHVGPNYATSGTVWTVGLLISKSIGTAQSESYTWGSQTISAESYSRPGAFVTKVDLGQTNAAILTQRTVTRDGANYSTTFSSFDAYGNPGAILESGPNGGSRSTTLTYNISTAKWLIRQVKDESFFGSSTSRNFDSNGNLLSVTRSGVTTSYGYNSAGDTSSATFPRGLVHNYSSHFRGVPTIETQPEGISISRTVDSAGNVTSETNGDGFTTSYAYDGLDRITSITYPVGNPVAISYTATTKTASRGIFAQALTEVTNYDGFGRPTSITLGGIARVYSYDALGRMVFSSNPGSTNVGTSFQYDILDRVTRRTNADSTFAVTGYGSGSRFMIDERNNTTTYNYRGYGDPSRLFLMSIASPVAGTSITMLRNSVDLVTSAMQGGVSRSYGYASNLNYHLTSVVDPETGTTSYGRDAAGNMTTRAVGASGTTFYTHDGQNRLTSVTYPGATPSAVNTYNKRGRVLTSNSSAAARTLTYDGNANLISDSLTIDGGTGTVTYGYNANDQLQSITYPLSGLLVNYSPDVLGRPTQVSGFATSVSYFPSGKVSQINYSNGAVTQYGQNLRLWTSSFATIAGGFSVANASYAYDGKGNLASVTDSVDAGYNRGLGYDNIDRLTIFNGPWGGATLSYDGVGNLTSQSAPAALFALNYSYDGNNRLSSVSGNRVASFSYDSYGNIVGAGASTYSYDGVPNMVCGNCSDPATRADYAYDGLGRRVSSTKAGIKTYEMYDFNGNLLFEYTPGTSPRSADHIYLGGKRIAQRVTP